MAKTINFNPAVQVSGTSLTVTVDITENGFTTHPQFAFDATDFDCNYNSANPYVAKFLFDPGDITMILEVQGDFTTVQFDGVTKASAYALAQDVVADIAQYNTGGGSYTFPANHGNVAYVSVDGNDGTGAVGNISKPFENCNAAIAALDNTVDGALIILSSTGAQTISDYDYTSHPYNLMVKDYSGAGFSFANSNSFGKLMLETKGTVVVSTDLLFVCDEAIHIDCDTFLIGSATQGAVNHIGVINCNTFNIAANTNNPSIDLGTVNWKVSCDIQEPLNSYVYINPRELRIIASQSDTDDPTFSTLVNNTGVTFTFVRVSNGEYELRASSAIYSATKSRVFFGGNNMNTAGAGNANFGATVVSSTVLQIKSYFSDTFEADSIMSTLPITIEVYP